MRPLFVFVSSFFFAEVVWAAACCGGGFALPGLISGDEKAQLALTYSYNEIKIENVDTQGFWTQSKNTPVVQTMLLEGTHMVADRYQAGFSLPFVERQYLGQNFSGLGDVIGTLGYTYLSDWNADVWWPKGVGFLQVTLPTGRSRAESETGWDSRGNGFWAVGAGTLLSKRWRDFDGYMLFNVHRSFAKTIATDHVQGTLRPGWGGSLGVGSGYTFLNSWRVGGGLMWFYEDPIAIEGSVSSKGAVERYATANLSLSYMFDDWTGTLSYTDQTWFGRPINTSLAQGVMLQLQKRWQR